MHQGNITCIGCTVTFKFQLKVSTRCQSNLKNDGAHFLHQVKHLRPRSTEFDAGKAFRAVFDHLNLFNAAHGYNTSGLGKFVGWSEMTFIFWLTTGERASSVPDPEGTALIIPPLTSPGANMFREPFRWDQRLFALLLHQDGTIPALMGQATNMAGDMSGDIFQISSARGMTWCIENIVGYRRYIHPGVAPQRCVLYESGMNVTWELIENPDAPTGKLLKAPIFFDKSRQHYAFFPIPEAYWCDLYTEGVPCVSSIPMITILAVDTTLSIPNGITPERFAIAHTEITDTLASKPPGTCWMVFVRGSDGSGGLGRPFGFLKMNSTGHTVHLNLLPYDPEKLFAVWGE